MLKKLIFSMFASLLFIIPMCASAAEDFSNMNPTVKITSHKKLFIDQALAISSGSGTVISTDGVVITNHHVIFDEEAFEPLDAFEICITFDVKKDPVCKYTAKLIANDKDMDIALLKIDSKDIFGVALPSLKYLDYKNSIKSKEQSEIRVVGYPGSGGDTITITKGQVSGFEKYNNYNYFKTDTDFDHGSSGGTAMDSSGNFIGIPTYIRSYAENVGYFLDITDARNWIDKNIGITPKADLSAEKFLIKDLARLSKANEDLKYAQTNYPYSEITLPNDWEFLAIDDDSFYVSQKDLSDPVSLSISASYYQFPIDKSYMNKLDEELEGVKKNYPDYKKEDVTIAGQKAWKITYTSYYSYNTIYYIPYGYAMVGLRYTLDLNEKDKQAKIIEPVLKSFSFTKSIQNDPSLTASINFNDLQFSISATNDWRIQKNTSKQYETLLAEATQKNNFEGSFAIYYDRVPKDEKQLTGKERLDDKIKNIYSDELVYKNDDVVLSGLTGFLYTYEYEGKKYQQMRKSLEMKIRDGDYEFTISYDDLTDNFDKNLPDVKKMLNSFKFTGKTIKSADTYSYGDLGFTFKDIQFHRYALSVSDLADKKIVSGYADGNFYPEKYVSRAEALKMILESKNYLEKEKKSGKIIDFSEYDGVVSYFPDINKTGDLAKYINYASGKKIISGYADHKFKPENQITLAEALKLITNVYEISVWKSETEPWYKKYMEKGFELNIIPYGMYDAGKKLTRAELAYLVSTVYKQAKY